MDQDPTWPPWIPAKEGTEESKGVSAATQPATAPQEEQP
jgi:hypothetical protein